MTKVFSAKPNGKVRRYINTPSVEERYMKLQRMLHGTTAKQSRNELRWLELKITSKFNSHINIKP